MDNYIRIATAVPKLKVADVHYNVDEIIKICKKASKDMIEILVFPQLCITGYTCGDLFFQQILLDEAKKGLYRILKETKNLNTLIIIGMPYQAGKFVINGVVICYLGKVLTTIINEEADERYFNKNLIFNDPSIIYMPVNEEYGTENFFQVSTVEEGKVVLAIPRNSDTNMTVSIGFDNKDILRNVDVNIILDKKFAYAGLNDEIKSYLIHTSKFLGANIVYLNPGMHESTTDGVMAGNSYIMENGDLVNEIEGFSLKSQMIISDIDLDASKKADIVRKNFEDYEESYNDVFLKANIINVKKEIKFAKDISKTPLIPDDIIEKNKQMEEIFEIQTAGLVKRMLHIGAKKAVVAVSGGLDSTLALLVVYNAFKKLGYSEKDIIGITMPGFGTTKRTIENAHKLMDFLNIDKREISIVEITKKHLSDIGYDIAKRGSTYENAQARERTQIAMDVANMENALVVGTGDLSELVLGFTTFNGDHMSMYSVNAGVFKTLVREVVAFEASESAFSGIKDVLVDILQTPISPELLPPSDDGELLQKTEDILGPYELNDFFIYYSLAKGYRPVKIAYLAHSAYKSTYEMLEILKYLKNYYKRFFSQQFKRSCLPDGISVSSVSISPRTSLKMPSDAMASLWIKEIDEEMKKYL